MKKLDSVLSNRLKKKDRSLEKMEALAEKSSTGNLSTFSNLFRTTPLSSEENNQLKDLLKKYKVSPKNQPILLKELSSITAELRAITHQAILLHGEKIKKAQDLLRDYKEGAFTAWLTLAYGNRQTPYNFLQYFEFYHSLSAPLQEKAKELPKQVIYTLASRTATLKEKASFLKQCPQGTKETLLLKIRNKFPLNKQDSRSSCGYTKAITLLEKAHGALSSSTKPPSPSHKQKIQDLLKLIRAQV